MLLLCLYVDACSRQLQTLLDVKARARVRACIACARLLQGCLAEPESQLLALIYFADTEDFPVQGHTPSNRLRSSLAAKGSPIAAVKWHLSTRLPTGWQAEGARGPGERGAASSSSSSSSNGSLSTVEERNCTRHLQNPTELAAVHTFPLSWLSGVHHTYGNPAGSTKQGCWVFFL